MGSKKDQLPFGGDETLHPIARNILDSLEQGRCKPDLVPPHISHIFKPIKSLHGADLVRDFEDYAQSKFPSWSPSKLDRMAICDIVDSYLLEQQIYIRKLMREIRLEEVGIGQHLKSDLSMDSYDSDGSL